MRRKFYLQHSLTAMYDPRIKKLMEEEKLRGLGAYWFIVEKLELLPEPRAQFEDLRPFCDCKKVPLTYLMKIIREYGLFIIEEDDYFMPAELNPVKKRGRKTEKNVPENAVSEQENGEKTKKTSKEIEEKSSKENRKTLNNGYLANCSLNNKENIKDITTAATEEKEETAAVAVLSPEFLPAVPETFPAVPETLPVVPETFPVVPAFLPVASVPVSESSAATFSPEPLAAGGKQPPLPPRTPLTVCDDFDLPERPLHPFRPWQELADGLLNESSAWLDIAYLRSGYGKLLRRHLKQAVEIFKTHIMAYGKGEDMLEMRDIQRYFINFVNAGSRTSKALHEALTAIDAKDPSDDQPADGEPYRYEQLINGQRSYQGCPIPKNAPPRPDETASWDNEQQCWITGKNPPKRKR